MFHKIDSIKLIIKKFIENLQKKINNSLLLGDKSEAH